MRRDVATLKGKYLYGEVAERIQEMIHSGEIKPGDKLPPERTLAESFKVSRNCLRQAIQTLSERGILESRQGDGTYACAPDDSALIDSFAMVIRAQRETLRQILEFRLLLEPAVTSLAATNITNEEIDRLKVIVCDQERRILSGQEDSELDEAFHMGLATGSRNKIVIQVMETLNDILNESRKEPLWNTVRKRASVIGHLKIIDALEKQDPQMAFEAMQQHLWSIEQIILGGDRTISFQEGKELEKQDE